MSAIWGRRLAFGAGGIVTGADPERLAELARSADQLGFDLFTLSDHLHGDHPTMDPWTALSWLAGQTERIELGTNVLGLPYRAPAVLAKMAETFDRVSGGRLVLGLGAGGYDEEFRAFGLPVRAPGAKITAQREAVGIIRSLWTGQQASFSGEEFRVDGARIAPLPAHPIPIWLGAYGPRALRLTGEVADGWLPSFGRIDLATAKTMRSTVLAAAEVAGRDPDAITCACNVTTRVDPTQRSRPGLVTGSADEVVEQLSEIIDAGFTTLLLGTVSVADQEALAADVMPHLVERYVRV